MIITFLAALLNLWEDLEEVHLCKAGTEKWGG
jgi:hypothetical protein